MSKIETMSPIQETPAFSHLASMVPPDEVQELAEFVENTVKPQWYTLRRMMQEQNKRMYDVVGGLQNAQREKIFNEREKIDSTSADHRWWNDAQGYSTFGTGLAVGGAGLLATAAGYDGSKVFEVGAKVFGFGNDTVQKLMQGPQIPLQLLENILSQTTLPNSIEKIRSMGEIRKEWNDLVQRLQQAIHESMKKAASPTGG